MTEIADFAAVFLFVTGAVALAVVSTTLTGRVPVPAPAIFLVAAALVSDIWPQIYEHVPILTVERIAVVALIVILFNGGMDIGWRRFRASAGPILSLGVARNVRDRRPPGRVRALRARVRLDAGGADRCCSGAYRSGGDVFGARPPRDRRPLGHDARGRGWSQRSCRDRADARVDRACDPRGRNVVCRRAGVRRRDGGRHGYRGSRERSCSCRCCGVYGSRPRGSIRCSPWPSPASSTAPPRSLHGSGFLAVFIAGLVLGDARLPYKGEIERFHSSLASLAEIVVFVALGLTISFGSLSAGVWVDAALLLLVLALGRTSARGRAHAGEGPAPVGRASIHRLERSQGGGPDHARSLRRHRRCRGLGAVYGIVFVVVLLSVVCQGTLVPLVARSLRIPMHERPLRPWRISVGLGQEPEAAHVQDRRPRLTRGSLQVALPSGSLMPPTGFEPVQPP